MTVEEVELRKILKQMLADEGINRTTLKDIIESILDTKVEEQLKRYPLEDKINRILEDSYKRMAMEQLYAKVSEAFSGLKPEVLVQFTDSNLPVQEAYYGILKDEQYSVIDMVNWLEGVEVLSAEDISAYDSMGDVKDLQGEYKRLYEAGLLNKLTVCNLFAPFMCRYKVDASVALKIARGGLDAAEIMEIIKKKEK